MNVKHSNEHVEHYTPEYIVESARMALGGVIDLDPCSCAFANKVVKAEKFYSAEGHHKPWFGNVFMNPPGGLFDFEQDVMVYRSTKDRQTCTETGSCGLAPGHKHLRSDIVSSAAFWWGQLADEMSLGTVTRAIFIGFSIELAATAQSVSKFNPLDFLHCVPSKRIPFDTRVDNKRVSGKGPTHNNIIVGLGDIKPKLFADAFRNIGAVWEGKRLA